jgi:hypothetical protein
MMPNTFGNSPELLLHIFATRNAEDIARAQRADALRTGRATAAGRAAVAGRRRWVHALRERAHRAQTLPTTEPAPRRA